MREDLVPVVRKARKAVVLTHSNADVDAVAAACALAYALAKLGVEQVRVLIPEGVSVDARDCAKLCSESFGVPMEVVRKGAMPRVDGIDLCVVVDTATRVQLKNLGAIIDKCGACIVIDHHREREPFPNVVLEVIDPNASSSSELSYEVCKALGIDVPKQLATMLVAGIVFDTRRFSRATPRMFRVLAELLELGASYEEALQLATPAKQQQKGSRIARIKCILRHRGFHVRDRDVFIAISEVGAFESQCANLLLSIGYDVAIVATDDEALRATRVVFRAREDVVERASLDVYNDIVKPVVERFGGGGGGHRVAGAAIVMCRDVDAVIKALGEVLRSKFGSSLMEIVEQRVLV